MLHSGPLVYRDKATFVMLIGSNKYTTTQVNELNACWNNVVRRLFGYNKWESVSALLLSLERLKLRCFCKTNMLTFAALIAKCPTNNL